MKAQERAELTSLLPPGREPELGQDRQRQLKEFLMTQILPDPAPRQAARPATLRRRPTRPAVLAAALAATAATMVVVPMVSGGDEAYAISRRNDGNIQITINDAKNPKQLQADLRRMGLNAVVDYIPAGKKCSPQPRSRAILPSDQAPLVVMDQQDEGFTIDPRVVKAGQTAVLEFNVMDLSEQFKGKRIVIAGVWGRVSDGPVAPCTLVDSAEAPLGPPPTAG